MSYILEGYFNDDTMTGYGRAFIEGWDDFGDMQMKVYTGEFNDENNNWPNGMGKITYPNGYYYSGIVRNGYWQGSGAYFDDDDNLIEENFNYTKCEDSVDCVMDLESEI